MYEPYIISSANVQMNLSVGSNVFNVATGVQLSVNMGQDVTEIFAIGNLTPIGIVNLNRRFSANLSLQSGEYETILDAINASITTGFISSLMDLRSFSIGWSLSMSELLVPKTIVYSLDNCRINSNDFSSDRNSPETNTSLSIQAIGLTRTVRNL